MRKTIAMVTVAAILAGNYTVAAAKDNIAVSAKSTSAASRHYDPMHVGHKHECPNCHREYNQPGDNGMGSYGTYKCPNCGYNIPAPPNPNGPAPYQPPVTPYNPGPYNPGPSPVPGAPYNPNVPAHSNPYNADPSYEQGYNDGYFAGYREAYSGGYQNGLKQGEQDGVRDGERDGYNKFLSKYDNYVYNSMELGDLIEKLNFQGRAIAIENTASNRRGPVVSAELNEKISRNGNYYAIGYNSGIMQGRNDGNFDGMRYGREARYGQVYNQAFQVGAQKADNYMHFSNGIKLSFQDHLSIGLEALNRNDYRTALLRFNLILIEEPVNASPALRDQAFWYAGVTNQKKGEDKTALTIFITHYLNRPEILKEETTLNIASMLVNVKTGGFLGIGSKKHYEKAKNMLSWWMSAFPASKRMPEALYAMGQCCERFKDKIGAQAVYQQIIDKFPQTSFAEDAKKRIKALNSWMPWD
ncbi:MAG: tetratricopeptide repeat protein [Candidatus Wallbacteria bacterium]